MLAHSDDILADHGRRSAARATSRLCAATRMVRPVDDMIRFVAGPDGVVVPDLKRRLPGRGIWVSAQRSAVMEAVRRKVFGRALRREVRAGSDLADTIDALLARAALDALAIASKAKAVVTGFARIEAALASNPVVALLHASDAAQDGVRKLSAAAKRADESRPIAVVAAYTAAQLDLALGRSNVVHAALLAGRESDGFLRRHTRLERFRSDDVSATACERTTRAPGEMSRRSRLVADRPGGPRSTLGEKPASNMETE